MCKDILFRTLKFKALARSNPVHIHFPHAGMSSIYDFSEGYAPNSAQSTRIKVTNAAV